MQVSRRSFLTTTALGAAGLVLAACAPKATPAPAAAKPAEQPAQPAAPAQPAQAAQPAPKEKILIKYHIFWNQPQACEEPFRATAEWKAMEESGLEIEFGTGRGGDAGRTAVAAGTPPDVGDLGPQLDFALGGKLMDLTPFVDASDKLKPEMFYEQNWRQGIWQGSLFGVPAHEGFVRRALYWNKEMVGNAGLDPETPPTTWEEMFEWHKKLTVFDAAGNMTQFGIDPYDAEGGTGPGGDGWCIADLWDIPWFDEATGEFQINHERMVEALDAYAEFVRLMGADNLQGMRSVEGQGTWGGSFNAEVQAMIIEGYWHSGETVKEKPEVAAKMESSWVPVPAWRAGDKIQTYSGHVSSLFAEGANAVHAFPVIEFLNSKAACDIIFNTIGWLPGQIDYMATVDGAKFPGLAFVIKSADEATDRYLENQVPIRSFIATKYVQYREQVFRDEVTAKEAADAFQKDVEVEWEESGWKDKWGAK
ncbi:MAG: extracellular solute-binding protein [Anaerolineae bacterium]|jgi:maltose-binding protein MalE